jgi:hypothetical protein
MDLNFDLIFVPTCKGFHVTGVSPAAGLYETTPKWHGFLMIKLVAFQASGSARIKLHEIQCHFLEVPHAVTE